MATKANPDDYVRGDDKYKKPPGAHRFKVGSAGTDDPYAKGWDRIFGSDEEECHFCEAPSECVCQEES